METPHWDYPYHDLSLGDNAVLPSHPGPDINYAFPDDFALSSPQVRQGPIQNAQFDPVELIQFSRDLNEGPRAFLPALPCRSVPNHGLLYPPLPAPAATPQPFWNHDHVEQGTGSASESGYASYKQALDQSTNWDRPLLHQGFLDFPPGQLSSEYFQDTASPSIVSDPTADRAHAPPLYSRSRSLRSKDPVPPCPLCGKVLKNHSEQRQVRIPNAFQPTR